MDSPSAEPQSLEDIRREIDRIDDAILKLVGERLAMVDHVAAFKNGTRAKQATPIRPAREAMILRRLVEGAGDRIPVELCFALWRSLISVATQRQAPVRVHGSTGLFNGAETQALLTVHFGPAGHVTHESEAAALEAVADNRTDIAAVAIDSPWLMPLLDGAAGEATVIGCLPFLARQATPRILILGHTVPEPTGADETLIVTKGPLPRDLGQPPRWQLQIEDRCLTSLPGFLSANVMPLARLARADSGLALSVVGRYPSAIEVKS